MRTPLRNCPRVKYPGGEASMYVQGGTFLASMSSVGTSLHSISRVLDVLVQGWNTSYPPCPGCSMSSDVHKIKSSGVIIAFGNCPWVNE